MRPEVRPSRPREPQPVRKTATAWRVRLVAKERREVLQARADPGVAFCNSEGLLQ